MVYKNHDIKISKIVKESEHLLRHKKYPLEQA